MNIKNKEKFCVFHPNLKAYCKGMCRKCYEKNLRELNPEYKKKQQENSRRWHLLNKEYKAKKDKEYRALHPVNKYKKYLSSIYKNYNVTEEEYSKLLKDCKNRCKLCGKPPYKNKRLHLDHNHITNEVRGLLCTRCNWYLHVIEKDPDILERIKQYLKL